MVYIPVESQEPKPEIPQVQTLPCPVPAFSIKTTYSSFLGLLSRSAQYLCLKLRDAPTGADGKWCYLHCVSHVKVVPWLPVISLHVHIPLRGAGLVGDAQPFTVLRGV